MVEQPGQACGAHPEAPLTNRKEAPTGASLFKPSSIARPWSAYMTCHEHKNISSVRHHLLCQEDTVPDPHLANINLFFFAPDCLHLVGLHATLSEQAHLGVPIGLCRIANEMLSEAPPP